LEHMDIADGNDLLSEVLQSISSGMLLVQFLPQGM